MAKYYRVKITMVDEDKKVIFDEKLRCIAILGESAEKKDYCTEAIINMSERDLVEMMASSVKHSEAAKVMVGIHMLDKLKTMSAEDELKDIIEGGIQ
jgi:hypothetical protein